MSPRPQSVTDADLLDGAARAISRVGVLRLTLAEVAAELRISAGTLVHRFGSKRGLLLALLGRSVGRAAERFAALRSLHGTPYSTLLALGDLMARHVTTPEALANHLAFLQVDLADPEFHRLILDQARAIREEIRALIRDAVAGGELESCDDEQLALALQATMNGSLLQWAIDREGDLAARIRENLVTVLKPLERGRKRSRR